MASRVFLNKYRAIRLLGEGGMGRAYLARQLDSDRLVVVKVLHEKYASTSHYRETFRREIDLLSRFRHPGVVELFEASMSDLHGPCLVMEYVQGEPPDELLRRHGQLEPDRVGRLLGHLCTVLQAAQAHGIIHRDLKPANILVVSADTPDERIKVLDFGMARLTMGCLRQNAPATQGLYIPLDKFTGARANATVGTPEYTCPEALRGDQVDHRGDLYSVGVILYELLTGHLPFDGPTVTAILSAHAHQPPPPFARWRCESAIPESIEAVVRACLAKDPADRPQSARELAQRYGEASGQDIWIEGDTAEAIATASVRSPACLGQMPQPPVAEESNDPHAVAYHLEAWMPEQVAAVKLRGFLDPAGGQVVESLPGLIRVLLPWRRVATTQSSGRGLWSRLGFGKPVEPSERFERAQMDVHLEKLAAKGPSRLQLSIRLKPAEGLPLQAAAEWRAWCDRLHKDMKAYLMV